MIFLNFALKSNVHKMTNSEILRTNYNNSMNKRKFLYFQNNPYFNKYRNTSNIDSVHYFYRIIDSMYQKETIHL